mmetsp:Transcript_9300/g.18974  ORF Transcript_9300/g.18974 Transcript_9300/m.18974 type:complete len:90 (+) Transcript_9300:2429-2698(+)
MTVKCQEGITKRLSLQGLVLGACPELLSMILELGAEEARQCGYSLLTEDLQSNPLSLTLKLSPFARNSLDETLVGVHLIIRFQPRWLPT